MLQFPIDNNDELNFVESGVDDAVADAIGDEPALILGCMDSNG